MEATNLKTTRQVVHLRQSALAEIGQIFDQRDAKRLFFVVDEAAYSATSAAAEMEKHFANRVVERFVGFELNPKFHDIVRGIERFRHFQPDMVIALGGGTAIDLAKLIGTLANHHVDSCDSMVSDSTVVDSTVVDSTTRDLITGNSTLRHSGPPLVAIPTTAGTGSEATHFAVAYVDNIKYSVAHPFLLPDYAIIDPNLTVSLPARETMASGLDAFCQAIESIWAVGATEQSVVYATEAAQLAFKYLPQAIEAPTAAARRGMCQAAHLSGKAINITKTTAPHALSYAITTDYGVPHGMAVAMTLAPILAFNSAVTSSDCNDPRGPQHVLDRIAIILNVLEVDNVASACDRIRDLISVTECPKNLAEIGIFDDAALQRLVNQVNANRLSNNPRNTTPASLLALLKEILL